MARPAAIVPIAESQQFINILVYGEPGCGKTVLAGTSPDVLILDADDGTESAARQKSTGDKWVVRDYSDLTEVYEYLRHEDHGYKWVWLDSGTIFQELGMDQILTDLHAAKPHRSLYIPDKAEYMENQNRLGIWVRNMKALPINFGITAHAMRTEDEDGKVLYLPAFQGGQGALSQKICGYMGIVGYMYVVVKKTGTDRVLLTTKRSKYLAKDRFDAFGGKLVNPTIPQMEAAVQKALGAAPATKAPRTRKATARSTSRK